MIPALKVALRRAAGSVQARTDALPMIGFRLGTVASVSAGAASDGNAAVSVTVNGSTVPAPYLAAYSSPTVGHMVLVLLIARSPVILGRVIGLPVV